MKDLPYDMNGDVVVHPGNKLLDREISLVSVQINQTRALLQALERQRTWMTGVQRGLYPDPTKDGRQNGQPRS